MRTAQLRTAQMCTAQMRTVQIRIAQIRMTQMRTAQTLYMALLESRIHLNFYVKLTILFVSRIMTSFTPHLPLIPHLRRNPKHHEQLLISTERGIKSLVTKKR